MTHLRKRVEPDALEEVLKATVMVDTTVQPKAIVHPTDSRLYLEALLTLAGQAKKALPAPLKRLRFEVSLFSNMKKARFSEEQIIRVLKEHRAGATASDLCRRHGISDATFYNWRSKCGGMKVSDTKKLKGLEAENAKLQKLLIE